MTGGDAAHAERRLAQADRSSSPAAAGAGGAPAKALSRTPAPAGAGDPIARHQSLAAAGALRVATAEFPDCPGESWRQVETDPQGRVVKLSRRGVLDGTPYETESYFDAGGALALVRFRQSAGHWREVRLSAAAGGSTGDVAVPSAILEPRRAVEAGLDAPARCQP